MRAYHQATKHSPMRFADGPHDLDWANQPDPFRRRDGAPRVANEMARSISQAVRDNIEGPRAIAGIERRAPRRKIPFS